VGDRFTLQQFSKVFQIRNADGQPYVLIGGQAVNYWAERYLAEEPELRAYRPFTSGDIDFQGNRNDVQRIAQQLDQKPSYPPHVAMTALAGAIPFKIGGLASNIEVVRTVPGVTVREVDALAVGAEFGDRKIRVLDPISLLLCKVDLALTVRQKDRQDVAHLKILFYCVRGFLRNVLQAVESGNAPAKGWLGAVNRVMRLIKSNVGRQAAKKFEIHWPDILPLDEIKRCKNANIAAFREKQLPRVMARIGK
jgi:hypothetical protein